MSRLEAHKQDLYELRFSPMCKPAAEVANLTQLESHTTRARTMMLWRIAEGYLDWGRREVELLYESTLDSISEAFDVFHYPISQYMLDARADVWEAGLAPAAVVHVIESQTTANGSQSLPVSEEGVLLLALGGELSQITDGSLLAPLESALRAGGVEAASWLIQTGALAYTLGARGIAKRQAELVVEGVAASGAQRVLADGPETLWALTKVYPSLGINLPEDVEVELLSQALSNKNKTSNGQLGPVFVHDSRAACFIADEMPNHLSILPGYTETEEAFGSGAVYEAPRRLVDDLGGKRVYGTWTRGLAKSCGADDGLWLTHPDFAVGLACQRLAYARQLGADLIVTDSPLSASWLKRNANEGDLPVYWLPELMTADDEGRD